MSPTYLIWHLHLWIRVSLAVGRTAGTGGGGGSSIALDADREWLELLAKVIIEMSMMFNLILYNLIAVSC